MVYECSQQGAPTPDCTSAMLMTAYGQHGRSIGSKNMNKLGAVAIAVGCWVCTVADAAVDVPPSTMLARSLYSYQSYGGGDVVFQLTQTPLPPSECYGVLASSE